MAASARILIVEDDSTIRASVAGSLTDEGLLVRAEADGRGFEDVLDTFRPDLVVLDWMLPGRDGIELARVTRARTDAGVVLLTAREDVQDRLRGFAAGADDYLPKPFVMAELIARLKAVLARLGRIPTAVQVGDLVVDEDAGVVLRRGEPVNVTATELRLLAFLAANRGRTVSSTQILTQVWGYEEYADNLIQVHISALRRKTEALGPRLIHTVRGVGYVLKASGS